MLKKLHWLVLSLGFFSSSLFAQIPAGYYDSATGTGYGQPIKHQIGIIFMKMTEPY